MKVCWVQGGVEVEQKVPIVFFHLTLIRGQRKKSTPLFILESFTVQVGQHTKIGNDGICVVIRSRNRGDILALFKAVIELREVCHREKLLRPSFFFQF